MKTSLMKKFIVCGLISLLAFSITPTPLQAKSNPVTTNSTPSSGNSQSQALHLRLEEIKEMDKTQLTSLERKELRKEVKSIKKQLETMNGGVYLSVGAVIIIVLLLILLL